MRYLLHLLRCSWRRPLFRNWNDPTCARCGYPRPYLQ